MNATLVVISEDATDEQIAESVFRMFATTYPHEAYAAEPERFWTFFHETFPNVARDEMERVLAKT